MALYVVKVGSSSPHSPIHANYVSGQGQAQEDWLINESQILAASAIGTDQTYIELPGGQWIHILESFESFTQRVAKP